MNQITDTANKLKDFVMSNKLTTGLVLVILILLIIILSRKENFEGMTEGVVMMAEYPAAFAEAVIPDFVKDVVYDNYFVKASGMVSPDAAPMTQLELPAHTATVPIDIGNGLAVHAEVQVPSQTSSVPAQTPMILPMPEKTDTLVAAQTVQIPAQSGIVPGKVEGSDATVAVPVDIPAQVITIPEQMAHVPVVEPFRM